VILVTGASGTLGSEVVRGLRAAQIPFRAAYHSAPKAEAAQAQGIDALTLDFEHPETLEKAFSGVIRLFLLGPPVPDQTRLELNAVNAAEAAGVRHVVKLSTIGAEDETFLIGRVHRQSEKALEASGMAWTFLRANAFMQNALTQMGETIRRENSFYSSSADGKVSHIDARDIAAVAVRVLTEPGHEGQAYDLTGPEALTYDAYAHELSSALGRTITHVNLSPEVLEQNLLAEGLPEHFVAWLTDLERYYREGSASLITDTVERLTGRPPTPFAQFARDHAVHLRSALPD
jgi:uncharacterized protein YbjT (DUF2867 family)